MARKELDCMKRGLEKKRDNLSRVNIDSKTDLYNPEFIHFRIL
jgi:hypothetical protein